MGLQVVSKEGDGEIESGSDGSDGDEPDWFEELCEISENSEEELQEQVKEIVNQYEGLVGKDAAAVLLGRRLGIDLVEEVKPELEVQNLATGMNDVCITVELVERTGVNSFDGGRVANWVVEGRDGKRTQVTFWNEDIDKVYSSFSSGDRVRIDQGYTKDEIGDYQGDRFGVPSIEIGDETVFEEVGAVE